MIEAWREWLYPLGFLPALIFTARYLLQWLTSEKRGKSVVMPLFWRLSIAANLLLMTHALIQQQVHVCLVQCISCVIAWRNLNLMKPLSKHVSFTYVVTMLAIAISTVPLLFISSSFLTETPLEWFRIPLATNTAPVGNAWHIAGLAGLMLFNGRFWVQWWGAEKRKESYLGVEFWWMSVIGSILCFAYFINIGDVVNMVGPLFGLIPSIRNLILIRRSKELFEGNAPGLTK